MLLKALLGLVVVVIALLLSQAFLRGKFLAKYRSGFRRHKRSARLLFWVLTSVVILLETYLRFTHAEVLRDELFWTHLILAILAFIGLFLLNWPMRGDKPHLVVSHAQLALATTMVLSGALVTAVPLILRM